MTTCLGHPSVAAVNAKTYYCVAHEHYEANPGTCSKVGCNNILHVYNDKVTYTMAPNPPGADKSGLVVDNDPGTYSVIK